MAQNLTTWNLDPAHSSATFSVKHMMIAKVHGAFNVSGGTLMFDRENPELSQVEANIDTASVDTREAKRDEHLKSPEFFDVARFPQMSFKSKRFQKKGAGEYSIVGDLNLHGVSHEVVLAVEGLEDEQKDPWGNLKIGASATTKIKRKDFGLTWNAAIEAGGVMVGDDVSITLEIQFIKKV